MSSSNNPKSLDPEELFSLALHANQNNDPGKAIEYLKELITISPEAGGAYYLLGATHAEIGMYDLAVEEMTTAVKLSPELTAARFQLGLLHLTSGRVDMAAETWEELQKPENDTDPFFYFCNGLLELTKDNFQSCIDNLSKGIKLNQANEPLNRDMQMMIDESRSAMESSPTTDADSTEEPKAGQHVLLNAYRNLDDDDDQNQ